MSLWRFSIVFNFQFWTCLANPKLKEPNRLIYSILHLGSWIQLEKITKSSKNCLCKLMFSELNGAIYSALQFSFLISFFPPFSIISNQTISYPLNSLTLSPSHSFSAEKNVFFPSQKYRNTGIRTLSNSWHPIYKVVVLTDHSLIMTANVSFWGELFHLFSGSH